MVHFATVRELRTDASRVLRRLARGHKLVITRNGEPIGVLHGVTAEDVEDYVLAHDPSYRRRYEAARREHRQGKARTLEEILGP